MTAAVRKALADLDEAMLRSPLKSVAGHWALILIRFERLEQALRENP